MTKRGPAPRRDIKKDFVCKAHEAWGDAIPVWVEELARAVNATSQGKVADRIGYSKSLISHVLSNGYTGDLSRIEAKVRGALMNETVGCPVLGDIGRDRCLDEQAKPFAATSSLRARLFRACRANCPHSRLKTT